MKRVSSVLPLSAPWAALVCLLIIACGTSATPTPVPTAIPTVAPQPTVAAPPTATRPASQPTSAPTTAPKPTAAPSARPTSAKDKSINVIATEPEALFWMRTADAHTTQVHDAYALRLGHLDRKTLQGTPTPAVKSWKQTAPNRWEYELRPNVVFPDGEAWNAAAWKTNAEFSGVAKFNAGSYAHTGPYTVEDLGGGRAAINCGEPCPLFDRGLSQSRGTSPKVLRETEFTTITIASGLGPYKIDRWDRGSKIILSRFDQFVPVAENPEYAAPILKELEFLWREETTVRTAMIQAGEADWAFLITLDDANRLGPQRFVTGGTAEQAQFRIDTIWDPWLSQAKFRQAVVHSIDCPAIVKSLYKGQTTCRGNHGAPGVLGITPENIKAYQYDPALSKRLLEEIGYVCGRANSAANCGAEIKLSSRASRIAFNTELVESMVLYMKEAGINAKANFVEPSIRTKMDLCGAGTPGAQVKGWKGATESKPPPTCDVGQIIDGIGFGYEIFDYAKFVSRHLLCESARGTVCVPEKEEEWKRARTLAGPERNAALQKIADESRANYYILPMFDLFAVYGINPKLRGFEEPRFDKFTHYNLWYFAP